MSEKHDKCYILAIRGAKVHLKQRFLERYGMVISNREIYAMINQIKNKQANFIHKTHHDNAIYGLLVRDKWVWIVYNSPIEFPITVLPQHETEQANRPT